SDWCDFGECHDLDGVHRTSGRIYKITHGKPRRPEFASLAALADTQLIELQLHRNDWYVRTARRLLQERTAGGHDMKAVRALLRQMFNENPDVTRKLRAMWALHVTKGTGEGWLPSKLQHANEHIRVWAVKLLSDRREPDDRALQQLVDLAKKERSGLVRLHLASTLQRLAVSRRGDLALALAQRGEDAADRDLPLMLWYGVEPWVPAEP